MLTLLIEYENQKDIAVKCEINKYLLKANFLDIKMIKKFKQS